MLASSTKHPGMRGIPYWFQSIGETMQNSVLHLHTNKLENNAILAVENWEDKEEPLTKNS